MYHIIINPASRSGRGELIWKEIVEPALQEKNVSYQPYFSEKAGDVKKLAAIIHKSHADVDNPCRLIILGGDGTVNEALQGIPTGSRCIIGYIPTGSSNDLARDVNISKNPLSALDHILSAEENDDLVKLMDRGIVKTKLTERSFAVSAGIGFDAAVCEEIMHSKLKTVLNRIKLGKLVYLGVALKQLFTAKAAACDLYLDDKEPIHIKKILFVVAMNHRYEGGGFKFCPAADYTDGYFDLCVVGNIPKLLILFALPTAFFGKHYFMPGINHYRAKNIRIKANKPLWLHTDGEVFEKPDEISVTCIQEDIRFII